MNAFRYVFVKRFSFFLSFFPPSALFPRFFSNLFFQEKRSVSPYVVTSVHLSFYSVALILELKMHTKNINVYTCTCTNV